MKLQIIRLNPSSDPFYPEKDSDTFHLEEKDKWTLKLQNDYLDEVLFEQGSFDLLAINKLMFASSDNVVKYKDFWIGCEYSKGSLIAIRIMDIFTKACWKFPCDMEGIQPFFGRTDFSKAIAWMRIVIDNIPTGLEVST